METLPVQYHLEVYEESFINDPSLALSATTPFLTFSKGDYFDHRTAGIWDKTPKENEWFQIVAVNHICWLIGGSHIGHKLLLCVKIVSTSDGF
jgi:hypothetical protein